ncbi:hypothetical protein SAMN05446037_10716 [Anaerovirgula multivorans]|uniref:Uncharacterized protein n=1 Tax=Anaerovirgula multivorans TaxID=312168 RepID=A0A239LB18_9FIRM|nr:hypothetical protein [Anaerovirgula multivorans]SNT27826.1 hypothetical protein SAMN05446037_10716 [Anaerovirgula multivorans]
MKNKKKVLGPVLSAIGFLGNIVLIIISKIMQVPVPIVAEKPNGTTIVSDVVMGNGFFPFLSHYKLFPLFISLCICMFTGIVFIILNIAKKNTDI